jgi:4-hydroxy-2-oxovalerate/4-hydroxy-2-oxohexanoate aldolase
VHVATHCTEADTSPQHIAYARKLGMDTTGFLMMAHLNSPEGHGEAGQADGGLRRADDLHHRFGRLHAARTRDRRGRRLREVLQPETEIGFHGHHNLGLGISNSIAAIAAGASRIDGSVAGPGRRRGQHAAGGPPAVCERMGIETGVDLFKLMDVAEDVIVPMMEHMVRIDRESLTLGLRACTPPSCCTPSAPARFGVPARDILVELGRRKMIAGQEDMIEDTAMTMAKERGLLQDVTA